MELSQNVTSPSDHRSEPSQARMAWTEFMTTGRLLKGQIRERTLHAWTRSRDLGCDPYQMKAKVLSTEKTQELLEQNRGLIEAAHPYLVALSRAAGSERHAAMLGDRHAIVLEIVGDEATVRDSTFPGPGSVLSEAVAGANGIGTPLADQCYAELIGAEHYIEGFHPYTCQGIPIRGSDNEIVGVLSTSVRRIEAAERIHEILICATHGIEAELRRLQLEKAMANLLLGPAKELGSSLAKLRQDILHIQAASWLQLQTAVELVSENEKGEALTLIEIAQRMSFEFKRQADLWQHLAEDTLRAPVPINMDCKLNEIVKLLETEARRHEIVLSVAIQGKVPVVTLDWGELSRTLLKALIKAFDVAGHGGRVDLAIICEEQTGQTQIEISTAQKGQPSGWILDVVPLPGRPGTCGGFRTSRPFSRGSEHE